MHVFTVCPACGERLVLGVRPALDPSALFGRCDGCEAVFRLYGGEMEPLTALPPSRAPIADAS